MGTSKKIPLAPPTTPSGFQPINTGVVRPPGTGSGTGQTGTSTNVLPNIPVKLPTLRLLSNTPIGGYGASTTATTTNVLWVDRGRGNVYKANLSSPIIETLSNTLVPKIFMSVWNKNLTSFVASFYDDASLVPTLVYTELIKSTNKISTTTSSTLLTPFELRGKNISGNVISYATSPDKSRLIIIMNENGNGVGYISAFNASNPTRLFTTPLTDINVSWPSDNIIAINTKGSASYYGFLYFVNPKTGVWTKVLGPLFGLSTAVDTTGKYVLYSSTGKNNDITTNIYTVNTKTVTEAVVRTLADKCVWGKFYKELVYCGVPSQLTPSRYPDDWYVGTTATVDKIWQINATTGEVKLISSLLDQADRILNVFNLDTDPRDHYLFFMNKNDLSFWSLDLVKSN